MADNSNEFRFRSSTRNALTAVITQIVMGVASFVERMVFNQCFISDYLGFYSLFKNIISVLSVAELGLSVAISFALYAPFAEDNFEEVNAILAFYRKVYRTVGSIILVGGIIFSFFLHFLVKTEVSMTSVTVYFYIFLLSTVFEYFFFYKSILFSANQKNYVPTLITNVCWSIMYCIQMVVSIYLQDFFTYAICIFIFTLVRCAIVNHLANKEYRFIKCKPKKLSRESRKKILQNVKGLISTKIGNVISDSTNGILISAMIGSSILGLYSNYQMITTGLLGFTNIIPNAITASIGNVGATESNDNVAESYRYIEMAYFLFYGIISIVLLNIINPVVSIFFGSNRCMPFSSAFLICLLFYIRNIKNLFGTYKSSLGLYWYDRYRPLITGISDFVLSIILGKIIGFDGIILGTIIAYTVIDLWVEPLIIFHRGFHASSRKMIATLMLRLVFVILLMLGTSYITSLLPGKGLPNLAIIFVVSTLITGAIFFIVYHRNKYMIGAYKAAKKYIIGKRNY